MEKTGEIKPGVTPDVENRIGEMKTADTETKTAALDDDAKKRLSDRVAGTVK